MSIDIQTEIALRAESYHLRNKGFAEWLSGLSEHDLLSSDLVEVMIKLLDCNNFGIDNGIDFMINYQQPVLEEWLNYDLIRDDGDEPLALGEALLNNPVPVLAYIDRFYEENKGRYESKMDAFKKGLVWGSSTGKFLELLEHNASTTDSSEWFYILSADGPALFKTILMDIMRQYSRHMNQCTEYNALLERWYALAK